MSRRRESAVGAQERWARLRLLQQHYKHFEDFLADGMEHLGFNTSAIQYEIGQWLEHGPQYLMVQAQRGQAKTTITALFAIWCLIHSPAHRILILTAAGSLGEEIAILIVRVIESMDVLECMRPDKEAGDRTAVDNYDLHHSLKGVEKSPSVTCAGIDSNLQGKRADLLIADDIESGKNSATPVQRQKIAHITKDFISICSKGRIIYLGTPQTLDSVYNSLQARGVVIRIWPGRYPTEEQEKFYGANLAPSIARAVQEDPSLRRGGGVLGDQGKPTDPLLLPEDVLQKKELDQGEEYFQLQHMLNTTLSDAMRHPLKLEKLVVLSNCNGPVPIEVIRGYNQENLRHFSVADHAFKLMSPHSVSKEVLPLTKRVMTIDPAAGGANGDETGYAIGGFLAGNVFVLRVGGIPGGYDVEMMEYLANLAREYEVDVVSVEKNMGHGAFRVVMNPVLKRIHENCQMIDDFVTGRKEKRIIETLGPVMGRGALIFDEDCIQQDHDSVQRYSAAVRQTYSLFYQMSKVTAQAESLLHDDRLDALEALVRHFQAQIAQDQNKAVEQQRMKDHLARIKDPLGHNRFKQYGATVSRSNLFRTRRGRR